MGKLVALEGDNLPMLDDQLSDVHRGRVLEFATRCGDWAISLTAQSGRLQAASMIRCGQERHDFERGEGGAWMARDPRSRFSDAHFYNLVHMATMEGLEWTVALAPTG